MPTDVKTGAPPLAAALRAVRLLGSGERDRLRAVQGTADCGES